MKKNAGNSKRSNQRSFDAAQRKLKALEAKVAEFDTKFGELYTTDVRLVLCNFKVESVARHYDDGAVIAWAHCT